MENTRFGHIDALRAVAVLLVIWTHYSEVLSRISGSWNFLDTIQRELRFGVVGVTIFFCISGMLIPSSLRGDLVAGAKSFLIKRFFRLYPAYWVSIPFGYFALWSLFDKPVSVTMWLHNVTMIPLKLGSPAMQGQYWTLQLELTFYVVCFYLFLFGLVHLRQCMSAIASWLAIFYMLSAVGRLNMGLTPPENDLYVNLMIMFWGACFRGGYDNPDGRGMAWATGAAVCISIGFMAFQKFRLGEIELARAAIMQVVSIMLFAMCATVMPIRSKIMQWIGKISYSIYLIHPVPLYAIFWAAQKYEKSGHSMPFYFIPALAVTIIMAWAMYQWIERPFNALGHLLAARKTKHIRPAAPIAQ